MISSRTEYGIMLTSLILSLCINGCSAWAPGHPSTPEASKGTDLTPRPAGTDSGGNLIPQKQVNRHDPAPERY
jgi:hypothetical protein